MINIWIHAQIRARPGYEDGSVFGGHSSAKGDKDRRHQ